MSTVLLSVGDVSGDPYAAELVRALGRSRPGTRFVGLAGDATREAGAELVAHQHAIAVGGIFELGSSLGRIISSWRAMMRAVAREKPDLAILIDTADFNIPLARKLKRAGVPVLYYVLPQVWAWRRRRIRKIAARADKLAVIFPFEPAEYERDGVRVEYVGHPLVDAIAGFRFRVGEQGTALRDELAIPKGAPVLALLPGSRRNEVAYQLPLQLETATALQRTLPELRCLLPLAPSVPVNEARALVDRYGGRGLPVELVVGRTYEAIEACDVALAKPGTVTLETALLGRPLVAAGRGHPLSAAILRRLVDVPAWAMPNLIAGERVVPEFLQQDAQPERVAQALAELIVDGPVRARQLAGLEGVRKRLGGGATERVCRIAEDLLGPVRA